MGEWRLHSHRAALLKGIRISQLFRVFWSVQGWRVCGTLTTTDLGGEVSSGLELVEHMHFFSSTTTHIDRLRCFSICPLQGWPNPTAQGLICALRNRVARKQIAARGVVEVKFVGLPE